MLEFYIAIKFGERLNTKVTEPLGKFQSAMKNLIPRSRVSSFRETLCQRLFRCIDRGLVNKGG